MPQTNGKKVIPPGGLGTKKVFPVMSKLQPPSPHCRKKQKYFPLGSPVPDTWLGNSTETES
jgi:hypothetical protein